MKKMNYIIILVIISFLVLPFERLYGEDAETEIKQLNEVEDLAVSADSINIAMFYNKSWAVVIGINKYEKWPGLEYAVNDAKSVESHLADFGFDEIITLMDSEATKNNITQVLGDKLPRQVHKEDRVLIFFAGHGQTEEIGGHQYGYIIPVDGEMQNYYSSAISMAQVREFSKRIQAKHIYYVIDACYSGLGLTRSGPRYSASMEGYLKKVTSLPAIQMLTAGGKGEQVLEADGHGMFTEYFLRGIEGHADADDDGVVTASELGAYLRPSVSKASEQKQTPNYGSLEGEGDFVFMLPAKGTQRADVMPDPELRRMQKEKKSLREREKALRSWEEMLRRQENELKKQIEIEDHTRPREDEAGAEKDVTRKPYTGTEDKRAMEAEVLGHPLDNIEIVQLRNRSLTLSKSEIRKMIEERGFRDSEWNPDGDFPNQYEKLLTRGGKVVIDYATGLMWQQSGSSNELSYREAEDYVDRLNRGSYAGFSDWRLPTVEELASLLEPRKEGVRYIDPLFDLRQQWFWSNDKRSSGKAWPVSVRAGIVTLETDDSKYYVRSVRTR
ncbi:MAG: hypothetical protein CMI55_04775 [Parcubacteria group bacterium]|nr:hypothetical protein [Parcubacteria group bacterium]|tara:strand:+ start:234 stop:1901 length:1668 start_codon:yes stop_codon:yes gene_type:complete